MSRTTYTDQHKAQVYVVLQTNEGNVKRTARDTNIPESTVSRWKKEWEENGPPQIDEEVKAAIVEYVGAMEETRDLALKRMHERLLNDQGTLPQIATVFGVLQDKIDRARGIGTEHTVNHRLTLPSPEELRATMGALLQGAQEAHAAREEEIEDAEFTEQPVHALPPGR